MEKNWSASLEHGEYVNNLGLLINDAMAAVSQTGTMSILSHRVS